MGWTVRGSNPGGGEIFRTCPYQPWVPPSLLYNGYRVFPGGKKRPGRDADPSPPSSAVGHERVELYLNPPPPHGPYGLYSVSVIYAFMLCCFSHLGCGFRVFMLTNQYCIELWPSCGLELSICVTPKLLCSMHTYLRLKTQFTLRLTATTTWLKLWSLFVFETPRFQFSTRISVTVSGVSDFSHFFKEKYLDYLK
jgi:hypothetical protein